MPVITNRQGLDEGDFEREDWGAVGVLPAVFAVLSLASACQDSPAAPTRPPATPTQLTPLDGTVFSHFPRTTTLTWTEERDAASYWVEVEFCQGPQCVDASAVFFRRENTSTTSYSFAFVGAQPGRWRVWAVGRTGLESPKSAWWVFHFTI